MTTKLLTDPYKFHVQGYKGCYIVQAWERRGKDRKLIVYSEGRVWRLFKTREEAEAMAEELNA